MRGRPRQVGRTTCHRWNGTTHHRLGYRFVGCRRQRPTRHRVNRREWGFRSIHSNRFGRGARRYRTPSGGRRPTHWQEVRPRRRGQHMNSNGRRMGDTVIGFLRPRFYPLVEGNIVRHQDRRRRSRATTVRTMANCHYNTNVRVRHLGR